MLRIGGASRAVALGVERRSNPDYHYFSYQAALLRHGLIGEMVIPEGFEPSTY